MKNIILTIGGSTTDQRFIDEKHTFQNVLSRKLDNKFAVLNGWVSGKSSFGHLFSIKNWHSKTLEVEKIKYIVYFFGINDTKLLNSVPNFEDYEADAYANNRFWRVKSFLLRYSFFYRKFRDLKNIYFPKIDNDYFFAYGKRSLRYSDKGRFI